MDWEYFIGNTVMGSSLTSTFELIRLQFNAVEMRKSCRIGFSNYHHVSASRAAAALES